jgi:hypothetical protein
MRRIAWVAAALVLSLAGCAQDPDAEDAKPSLAATPYEDAGDVSFYVPYKPGHQGFDFSASHDIVIRAPSSGRFEKKLYYHAGVPRWQVNATIYSGDAAVDCLFEPGEQVTEQQGRQQFDMLIPDGQVKAGDVLGRLLFVPGSRMAIFHLGVRESTSGGEAQCPLTYATPEVRESLLALFGRDLPGQQICFGQGN